MDECVDKVEEAIRRAEELMSRDMEMLNVDASLTATSSSSSSAANRYEDPEAREQLIGKLLKEREDTIKANEEVKELSDKVEIKELERRREEELGNSQARKENKQKQQNTESQNRSANKKAKGVPSATTTSERKRTFYRKSLDQVRRQVELERSKDCTFKPKISHHPKIRKEALDERLDRLAKPRSEYYRQQEEQRRELEREELSKLCTFKPDISMAQAVLEETAYSDDFQSGWQRRVKEAYRNHVSVEKRLHLDARQRWEARDRAKRELEEAELQAQPFKPKVNDVSEQIARQIDYEPIEHRAARVQREKQERLAKKKLETELNDKDLTFKPEISENSSRIAMTASIRRGEAPNEDVVQRLLSKSNDINERQKHRQQAWVEQQETECKFKPKVSSNTKKILGENPHFKKDVDFVKRQELLEEERVEREKQRRARMHDMTGIATFRPKLHNTDRILVASRPERLSESPEQRFERLAHKDQVRKSRLQQSIREHYYSQFDFQPKISRVSAEIVKDTHKDGQELYEDLYRNERSKHFREVVQTQVEEESLRDCTFKPKTLNRRNTKASEAIRNTRFGSDQTIKIIEESRRKKEKKMMQQRMEREYEQLKECTFTPEVNETVPKGKGPVIVRGLGRYLELRELAKRQNEEQKSREDRIFMSNTDAIRPEPYTIPQPFRLSGPVETLRPKYRGELPSDCTFKPKTNIGRRQKSIQRMLAQTN